MESKSRFESAASSNRKNMMICIDLYEQGRALCSELLVKIYHSQLAKEKLIWVAFADR
jgi:hypothetical protein